MYSVCTKAGKHCNCLWALQVLRQVDDSLQVRWRSHDGDRVRAGDVLGEVRGPARSLLTAERTALNFLQRMSGIASATAAMVLEVLVRRCSRVWALCVDHTFPSRAACRGASFCALVLAACSCKEGLL